MVLDIWYDSMNSIHQIHDRLIIKSRADDVEFKNYDDNDRDTSLFERHRISMRLHAQECDNQLLCIIHQSSQMGLVDDDDDYPQIFKTQIIHPCSWNILPVLLRNLSEEMLDTPVRQYLSSLGVTFTSQRNPLHHQPVWWNGGWPSGLVKVMKWNPSSGDKRTGSCCRD